MLRTPGGIGPLNLILTSRAGLEGFWEGASVSTAKQDGREGVQVSNTDSRPCNEGAQIAGELEAALRGEWPQEGWESSHP